MLPDNPFWNRTAISSLLPRLLLQAIAFPRPITNQQRDTFGQMVAKNPAPSGRRVRFLTAVAWIVVSRCHWANLPLRRPPQHPSQFWQRDHEGRLRVGPSDTYYCHDIRFCKRDSRIASQRLSGKGIALDSVAEGQMRRGRARTGGAERSESSGEKRLRRLVPHPKSRPIATRVRTGLAGTCLQRRAVRPAGGDEKAKAQPKEPNHE